ncbi:MAG: DUF4147 domain-containing protein [Thermomicrobiales bacterium]|nr:DUF4147 domain-containing protein [Thermomicrobiales bacterium]
MTDRTPVRALIESIFDAALAAVEPSRVVASALTTMVLPEPGGKVVVVAIGKAAEAMASGAVEALGSRIDTGFVVTKDGHLSGALDDRFVTAEASHPVPDQRGVEATRRVVEAVRQLTDRDLLIALISGGGSALFEAPRPPLELADIAAVTQQLLQAGAPIQDLNAVRIPLSMVKGGGLRREAAPARVVTLLLSDVLGNDPHFIASGPTVPGGGDASRALALLRRYGVESSVPRQVLDVLNAGNAAEDVDTSSDVLEIVGDNAIAVEAARVAAETRGFRVDVVWNGVEGEAAELGRQWVDQIAASDADVLLGGGEATVTVRGEGCGGRNTEFALAAAIELASRDLTESTVASLATDGQDALTGAAGAIVNASVVGNARARGLDAAAALASNDSASLLGQTGNLVITGPTGTNVNDLYIAVRSRD